MTPNLAIYTSHDASIAVRCDDGSYHVAELERIAKQRYYSLDVDVANGEPLRPYNILEQGLAAAIKWNPQVGRDWLSLRPLPRISEHVASMAGFDNPITGCGHHDAHAACAFYQSPFDKATVITYDGGGPDADGTVQYFCCYDATREGGCVRRATLPLNLGTSYREAATYVDEIQRTSKGNWLSWPGKLMALAAYGVVNTFYFPTVSAYMRGKVSLEEAFLPFKHHQFDWCATIQAAFEGEAMVWIRSWADKSIPLCISGGCALNVKVNQLLREAGYTVFVPPNPNDSGLALGMLLEQDKPKEQVVCTYNGLPWPGGEEKYPTITLDEAAERLRRGQIIGHIEGDSELGPRALGHRSILCKGSLPHARARLNAIKGREWYRPVSPVMRGTESPFMSFSPRFDHSLFQGAEWRHIDGTVRLQTTGGDCSTLWQLMKDWPDRTLINTSLNLKGRPLCNSLEDAMELLNTTALDCLVVNGHLIEK